MKYQFADLCLDTGRRLVCRGEENLKLTKLSYKVCEALVRAAPNLLTHDELIAQVWGEGRVVSPENLAQRVTMLRQTLGDNTRSPTYVETVYGQGFRLIPEVTIGEPRLGKGTASGAGSRKWPAIWIGAASSLIFLGIWAFNPMNVRSFDGLNDPDETTATQPVTIAVLPFVNLSDDPSQNFFVDGLTEEVLNSLVTIDGLLVTGRTSSFVYKDKNVDLRQIGDELGVEYLLEGSVRKSGDRIRVTAQLIDAASGLHMSSSVYDRNVSDLFAVQDEISKQVAADLKISLIHKDDQYNAALERLDAVAVEQLLTARAQIAEYAGVPARAALSTLEDLNNRYPDTPEIMGLIAFGHLIYGATGDADARDVIIDYSALATATLALDPTNLDALTTLAVTADDFAAYRIQAIQYYQELLRYHPGRADLYSYMLDYLYYVYTPCNEIRSFIQSVPDGVFGESVLTDQHKAYETCTNQPWGSGVSDDDYLSLMRVVAENPNQRFLSLLYIHQLRLGAWAAAKKTALRIDYTVGHWWASYAAGYNDMYDQPSDQPADRFIDFIVRINYGAYDRSALLLIHRGALDGDFKAASDYLDELPEFPIEVATHKSSMALMMLQHRTGDVDASVATANRLAQALDRYLARAPGSYRYYNLAKFHLISAVYSNDFEQARQILDTGFADDHPYWQDDIAAVRIVLSPWIQHPVVEEYVDRIELDRIRARGKFGIQ